jgi:hypothetical protein
VTQDQAARLLGVQVQFKKDTTNVGVTRVPSCQYSSVAGATSFAFASLGLIINKDAPSASAAFDELEKATRSVPGTNYQQISGIGDGAFFDFQALYVLKDNVLMVILTEEGNPASNKQDAARVLEIDKQFALQAVQHL